MVAKKEDSFIAEFNRNPDEKNWDTFKKRLVKDKAKYYYVVYPNDVKDSMNLKAAYAVIYNGAFKPLYKVPIIKTTKKGIEGTTIYFKDLQVNRRAI